MNIIRLDFTRKLTEIGWNLLIFPEKTTIIYDKPIILDITGKEIKRIERQVLHNLSIISDRRVVGGPYVAHFASPRHLTLIPGNGNLYLNIT
jgi:hypothetical protein